MKFNKQTAKIATLATLSLVTAMALDVRLKVVNYKIRTNKVKVKVKDKVKIALITDLHSCRYGKNQITLINAIKEAKPDVILLGGDIFDDEVMPQNTMKLLSFIGENYPCYYVTGNHEFYTCLIGEIFDVIRAYGIHVLNGCYDTIDLNGSKLNICGIDDKVAVKYLRAYAGLERQLEQVNEATKNGNYSILLTHRPELIETYLNYDFDLILSGHAHGGQWRIPYLVNGVYAPNQGILPKYAGGRYRFDSANFIVSRGLARESTAFVPRIFNRPELVMIELGSRGPLL